MDYPAACAFGIPPVGYDRHDLGLDPIPDPDPDADLDLDLSSFRSEFGLLSDLDFDGDVEFCIDDLLDFPDAEDPPPVPPDDSSFPGCGGRAASSSSSAPAGGAGDSSGNSSTPGHGDSYVPAPSPESGGSSTKPLPPPAPADQGTEEDEPSDGNKPVSVGFKRKKELESSDEGDDESDDTNARSSTAADAAVALHSKSRGSRTRRAAPFSSSSAAAITADEAEYSSATAFHSGSGADDDEKRKARLMRNRESAQLSRQRKKQYVEELEEKVRAMHSTISDLNSKISYIMAENATLRHQLGATTAAAAAASGGGASGGYGKNQGSPSSSSPHPAVTPPAVGVYPAVPPMAPMPFPWIPGYAVRPQPGAQVPLVPIPRLRTQQPAPPTKARKSSDAGKKGESKSKTKKVASVSFLGMILFLFLVGSFVPRGNLRIGGSSSTYSTNGDVDPSRGRVLTVTGDFDRLDLTHHRQVRPLPPNIKRPARELQADTRVPQGTPLLTNASREPLVASLYVPRNDKLVKIDGNLIISSVLASEKAMAHKSSGSKAQNKATAISTNGNNKDSNFALAGSVVSALVVANSGKDAQRQRLPGRSTRPVNHKALPPGPRDNLKSIPADRPTQEWFREGLEGPILSSGMCTEVFQFEASPASGSIVPASSAVNATNNQTGQAPCPDKIKSRRILYPQHPIPLPGLSQDNNTNKAFGGEASNFSHSKGSKSMVVSVLVDPREVGDGDVDGVLSPKSISRIFVVVLVDSVKYITYSCMLPLKSNAPHLVTA